MNTSSDRLWSVQDVADYLGIPLKTLYNWRTRGIGPRARRVGTASSYRTVSPWAVNHRAGRAAGARRGCRASDGARPSVGAAASERHTAPAGARSSNADSEKRPTAARPVKRCDVLPRPPPLAAALERQRVSMPLISSGCRSSRTRQNCVPMAFGESSASLRSDAPKLGHRPERDHASATSRLSTLVLGEHVGDVAPEQRRPTNLPSTGPAGVHAVILPRHWPPPPPTRWCGRSVVPLAEGPGTVSGPERHVRPRRAV
jgi:hypothetical protein